MGLKKYVQLTALAAALTVSSMTVCAAEPAQTTIEETEVAKEDSVYAGLDAIIAQVYAAYNSGDYATLYAVDLTAENYVQLIQNAGADRYICDLGGDTYGMMYVSPAGGWYWYFGQMQNNLRNGQGTTILAGGDDWYNIYTGSYANDLPYGEGSYKYIIPGSWIISISGTYQGPVLNGTYLTEAYDVYEDMSEQVRYTYINGHLPQQDFTVPSEKDNLKEYYLRLENPNNGSVSILLDDGLEYYMIIGEGDDADIPAAAGRELVAYWDMPYGGWQWLTYSTEELNSGFIVLRGNPNGIAVNTSITEATPVTPQETTPETPAVDEATVEETTVEETTTEQTDVEEAVVEPQETESTVVPSTYTVERGDNLCKIAKKLYGDEKYYINIYKANADVIKDNYIIFANQVLVIPEI